jgi:2-C-methyl-D-erythritol 4-phosphate cytidylyltransferase/2-C-methyl-D-erythritol 2,4-cyclodiphosphate synthase
MRPLFALVPAAGVGKRAISEQSHLPNLPKQYQTLNGKPLLIHTLTALFSYSRFQKRVVVISPDDAYFDELILPSLNPQDQKQLVVARCGGVERSDSVRNGLAFLQTQQIAQTEDWVMVHDAARPLITSELIERLWQSVTQQNAIGGLLAMPVSDTVKYQQNEGLSTLPRQQIWLAQTPQMFRIDQLEQALIEQQNNTNITDEACAMEACGHNPLLVESEIRNFKITYPVDFQKAEQLMQTKQNNLPFRTGLGFDSHALVENRPLILGGIQIPFEKGLKGHSDADCVLHAITDALLGALALGDIGTHFPDTDERYRGANSGVLLAHVLNLVHERGYRVGNLDVVVIAQAPKLAPYREAIVENIARLLEVETDQVSLKAKTAERLGSLGRGEGIATHAVVMLIKN